MGTPSSYADVLSKSLEIIICLFFCFLLFYYLSSNDCIILFGTYTEFLFEIYTTSQTQTQTDRRLRFMIDQNIKRVHKKTCRLSQNFFSKPTSNVAHSKMKVFLASIVLSIFLVCPITRVITQASLRVFFFLKSSHSDEST